MSENLKELLEKINQDGIKSGEEKARLIEDKAKKDAEKIIENARVQADKIMQDAKLSAEKMKINGEASLKQASRDFLLSLKNEITNIFNKILAVEINKTMSQDEMADILASLIQKYADKNGDTRDIKVLVKKEDLEKIKNTTFGKLKDKIKEGVEFRPSQNINTGFSISLDKGRSFFDFSDEALLETLCVYLNPELARLIK